MKYIRDFRIYFLEVSLWGNDCLQLRFACCFVICFPKFMLLWSGVERNFVAETRFELLMLTVGRHFVQRVWALCYVDANDWRATLFKEWSLCNVDKWWWLGPLCLKSEPCAVLMRLFCKGKHCNWVYIHCILFWFNPHISGSDFIIVIKGKCSGS